ncbi:hypothetical protein PSPO01_05588 [Paraphaeosphaeria sporulosa]
MVWRLRRDSRGKASMCRRLVLQFRDHEFHGTDAGAGLNESGEASQCAVVAAGACGSHLVPANGTSQGESRRVPAEESPDMSLRADGRASSRALREGAEGKSGGCGLGSLPCLRLGRACLQHRINNAGKSYGTVVRRRRACALQI